MEHIAWIQGKRENHFDSHSLQDMVLYNAYAEVWTLQDFSNCCQVFPSISR